MRAAPIRYLLDAPGARRELQGVRRDAVVVADPSADLPQALSEGRATQSLLGAHAMLLAQGAATREHVLFALEHAALLHFAGHARYAGLEGVGSGLQLADGFLSLGDVIALRAAPPTVVLSACEGSRTAALQQEGGLGVAEAFVVSGAQSVIAASRPVADHTARALFASFYAARAAQQQADDASALRSAQLSLWRAQPESDWASFRLLVP